MFTCCSFSMLCARNRDWQSKCAIREALIKCHWCIQWFRPSESVFQPKINFQLNVFVCRDFNVALISPVYPILKCSLSSPRNRSSNLRRRWSTVSSGWGTSRANSSAGPGPNRVGGTTSSSGSDGTVKLHLGMQVLLISANEMGTIRYIGTADFAPGLWLGLELRSPKGKNDGSVGIRRYFSCRPGHGVLVRPSRVTYRGINGAKLVDESSWDCHTLKHGLLISPPIWLSVHFVSMDLFWHFSQPEETFSSTALRLRSSLLINCLLHFVNQLNIIFGRKYYIWILQSF